MNSDADSRRLGENCDVEERVLAFILSTGQMNATERYLSILEVFHRENPVEFVSVVLNFDRYSRAYFARSRGEIEDSGRSTQPAQIPGSSIWALTNIRAERKQEWLKRVATALSYGPRVLLAIDAAYSGKLRGGH
jgi:negative regulator of replication initiation